jgi:hypothetical protein
MTQILWLVVALLIAGVIVFASALATRRRLPPIQLAEGETLPKTALQKRAAWTLSAVAFLVAAAGGCVAFYGPQVWWDDDTIRLSVTSLLLAGLLVYLAFTISIRALEQRGEGVFDERDSLIMNRSCAGVGGAMMVVIAVWMVALTEAHSETRLIPSYFLYLMFWSCVMTNVTASLAGILLAYRRS